MSFDLVSPFEPMGDQITAIKEITENYNKGEKRQTLLGGTGTGKTFTMCNIIKNLGKKTLILAHNKTLAGQLYNEVKNFFPNNHVEYFISYYDYYQPEAYVASSDTYIEKDAMINEEIDEMRHSATAALLDYDDVIVIASVSCIYGIGDPEEYKKSMMCIRVGEEYDRKELIRRLIEMQYIRNELDFARGSFRVNGDIIDIILPSERKTGVRLMFFDDEVERIQTFDVLTGEAIESLPYINIFAATHFMTDKQKIDEALKRINAELNIVHKKFLDEGKYIEAERIEQRTRYDLEMLREVGTCKGIENYSRHLTLRKEGDTPATLIDFFGDDFLLIVDESHVTLPQVRGMYNGDRSRKMNLVNYGFRLPSALDNRPLLFDEFEQKLDKVLYVSATPAEYELQYPVVEQIIRPTGLLDPIITIKPTEGQIDDIYAEVVTRKEKNERVLITTLTKRMAEDLTKYLQKLDLNVAYIHSEVKSLERLETIRELRLGTYDCLVGINLLREGIDIPEVSLVCILDADKQGFLRSERSLIQTIGRAARNSNGRVNLYADKVSPQMEAAIEETERRRMIQQEYNIEHNITPKTISKPIPPSLKLSIEDKEHLISHTMDKLEKEEFIAKLEEQMNEYAKALNFEMAMEIRDMIIELKGKKK